MSPLARAPEKASGRRGSSRNARSNAGPNAFGGIKPEEQRRLVHGTPSLCSRRLAQTTQGERTIATASQAPLDDLDAFLQQLERDQPAGACHGARPCHALKVSARQRPSTIRVQGSCQDSVAASRRCESPGMGRCRSALGTLADLRAGLHHRPRPGRSGVWRGGERPSRPSSRNAASRRQNAYRRLSAAPIADRSLMATR